MYNLCGVLARWGIFVKNDKCLGWNSLIGRILILRRPRSCAAPSLLFRVITKTKREWSKRANPPIHDPLPMKIIFNLFLALCHTAWLFWGRHLIGRLEWRHVILNLAGNSFHCRSRTASDMTCKLGITFADESKDVYVEKSGQSSCRRAKRSWLLDVRRRERFPLDGNC